MHGGRHGRGRAGARDISPVSPTNPSPPALAGLFAEGPGDRRDRLTQIMVDRNIATAATSGMTEEESRKSKEETSDVWYHEGPPQLADARKAIAGYSLARARDRLKEARLRLARPDRTVRARRTQQHADLRVRRNDCRCCCGATMTASGCVYRSPCPHPDLTPTSPRPHPDLNPTSFSRPLGVFHRLEPSGRHAAAVPLLLQPRGLHPRRRLVERPGQALVHARLRGGCRAAGAELATVARARPCATLHPAHCGLFATRFPQPLPSSLAQELHQYRGHTDRVSGLAWHPKALQSEASTSLTLASCGVEGDVLFWSRKR